MSVPSVMRRYWGKAVAGRVDDMQHCLRLKRAEADSVLKVIAGAVNTREIAAVAINNAGVALYAGFASSENTQRFPDGNRPEGIAKGRYPGVSAFSPKGVISFGPNSGAEFGAVAAGDGVVVVTVVCSIQTAVEEQGVFRRVAADCHDIAVAQYAAGQGPGRGFASPAQGRDGERYGTHGLARTERDPVHLDLQPYRLAVENAAEIQLCLKQALVDWDRFSNLRTDLRAS